MIALAFLQINAIICLIREALMSCIRRQSQIVRIHHRKRQAGHILHPRRLLPVFADRSPCIAIIVYCIEITRCAKSLLCLKGTVLNHLRIESAICSKIDILKKETNHFRRNFFSIFTCKFHCTCSSVVI